MQAIAVLALYASAAICDIDLVKQMPTYFGAIAGNAQIASFRQAKVHLAILYAERPRTLYSNCAFGQDFAVDYADCAYQPLHPIGRATRIEWEHIVPADVFGQTFAAWRQGDPLCVRHNGRAFRGRRCAAKVDAEYRRMEADLYNLVPEVGEINLRRSDHPMMEIPDNLGQTLAGLKARVFAHGFEPGPEVRGDVARAYLYMAAAYPEHNGIAKHRLALYRAWDRDDPPDAWECRRARRIHGLQGNVNPFVSDRCPKP